MRRSGLGSGSGGQEFRCSSRQCQERRHCQATQPLFTGPSRGVRVRLRGLRQRGLYLGTQLLQPPTHLGHGRERHRHGGGVLVHGHGQHSLPGGGLLLVPRGPSRAGPRAGSARGRSAAGAQRRRRWRFRPRSRTPRADGAPRDGGSARRPCAAPARGGPRRGPRWTGGRHQEQRRSRGRHSAASAGGLRGPWRRWRTARAFGQPSPAPREAVDAGPGGEGRTSGRFLEADRHAPTLLDHVATCGTAAAPARVVAGVRRGDDGRPRRRGPRERARPGLRPRCRGRDLRSHRRGTGHRAPPGWSSWRSTGLRRSGMPCASAEGWSPPTRAGPATSLKAGSSQVRGDVMESGSTATASSSSTSSPWRTTSPGCWAAKCPAPFRWRRSRPRRSPPDLRAAEEAGRLRRPFHMGSSVINQVYGGSAAKTDAGGREATRGEVRPSSWRRSRRTFMRLAAATPNPGWRRCSATCPTSARGVPLRPAAREPLGGVHLRRGAAGGVVPPREAAAVRSLAHAPGQRVITLRMAHR